MTMMRFVLLAVFMSNQADGFTTASVKVSRGFATVARLSREETRTLEDFQDIKEKGLRTSDDVVPQEQGRSFPLLDGLLSSYWGPRGLLAIIPAVYGTNFALGSLMDAALPAPEVTALRMSLAAVALLPWLVKIDTKLLPPALFAGCCTATGYVAQSLALVDTDPARVSFLGAAIVLWCPVLEFFVDGRDLSWKTAPQTWIAALLCFLGVGVLEGGLGGTIAGGDALALLQAIGFGTQCFLCSKLVKESPEQVLSITAVLVATTAAIAWLWCFCSLPGDAIVGAAPLLHDPVMIPVLGAILWTGLVSTSGAFAVEVAALGRVPSSEASVLLATEPIWAAIFASFWLGGTLAPNEYAGGALMIAACLVNAVRPQDLKRLLPSSEE